MSQALNRPLPAAATGLKRLKAPASVDDVVAALRADGAVVIEDLVGEELLDAFMAELQPYLDITPAGEGGFIGGSTRRCGAIFAKAMTSAQMVQLPPLLEVVESVLGVEKRVGRVNPRIYKPNIQVSTTQCIHIMPGQAAQPLHRDDGVHHNPHPGPEVELNTMYAISDFTRENGATRLIPGSHLWDDDREPTEEDTVPAEMRRGSVLMWLGSVWHGGGANTTTDQSRTGVVFGYAQGHLRQEENQYLVVPLETVRKYPPRIRDLLGYRVQLPGCGVVEGQDCAVVLERDDWTILPARNLRAPVVEDPA